MSVLYLPQRHTPEEIAELEELRYLLNSFEEKLSSAQRESLDIPENMWELLRLLIIDEVLRELKQVTLFEFQAVEYLATIYAAHPNITIYENSTDPLKSSEKIFIKYVLGIGNKIPAVRSAYESEINKGYNGLRETTTDTKSQKFYGAVLSVWYLVAKHCQVLHSEITKPSVQSVK